MASAAAASTEKDEDVLKEVKGDLFGGWESVAGSSLGHCVSQCMKMGAGIAVQFKKRFARVEELKAQGAKIGGVACLALPPTAKPSLASAPTRFVYYLVTKERYFHKPTYASLTESLKGMREHCVKNGVKRLCLPRVGCGLDGLEWSKVREILRSVFRNSGIAVVVYCI